MQAEEPRVTGLTTPSYDLISGCSASVVAVAARGKSAKRQARTNGGLFICVKAPGTHCAGQRRKALPYMTNPESDGLFDNDWDDCGELSWTEADWQKYLANQETAVRDYIKHYDQLPASMDRIDEAARRMGWELAADETPEALEEDEIDLDATNEIFDGPWDPYTLHRNPVYISSRALYLSLIAHWERVAAQPGRVPPALGITLQALLYRGHEQALQAVQALEMGDYTLAVVLFKRALQELNLTLARLNEPDAGATPLALRYKEYATPRLFDLREIWLRVMNECRQNHGGSIQPE
jgi:hypothetical protein